MLKNYHDLGIDYKDRFLKMCLLLFPQYRSARLKSDGTVVFISKLSVFRRVKIPFISLISEDIVKKLSILQWNNKQLAKKYFEHVVELRSNYDNTEREKLLFVREVIDFLYSKLLITKLKDIYNGYYDIGLSSNGYKVTKESSSDTVFVSVSKDKIKITTKPFNLQSLIKELQKGALTIAAMVMLNLAATMFILSSVSNKPLPIVRCPELIGESLWKITYFS